MNLRFCKNVLIVLLAVLMTHVPQIQAASGNTDQMVSTTEWVNEQNRELMVEKVTQFINRSEVTDQLAASGVTASEASNRVASLSDAELQQLSSEIDRASYGGDVLGILVVVLVVILIIYLVKRI